MKNFFKKNFREILIFLLILVTIFLFVKILTPPEDKSELLKYKLEQLNIEIDSLNLKQKKLDDSIKMYKEDIENINKNIENIRTEKTIINNYYENKSKKITTLNNKEIDSLLRNRYDY